MSLRTDIHAAFDEIAPSTYGISQRVVRSAVTGPARPRRRFGWSVDLRGAMALVAVLLMLVLAVGALAGGRLYRDWTNFNGRSSQVADLEARPLNLPAMEPGRECPAGPPGPKQGFGAGPVYVLPGPKIQTAWGTYVYPWVLTDRGLGGLVLGRGKDLVAGQPVVFVDNQTTGPVVGNDRIDGLSVDQHQELLLDTNHPQEDVNPPAIIFEGSDRYVAWQIKMGLPAGAGWCVGMQFDGPGFSEVLVVPALDTGPPLD